MAMLMELIYQLGRVEKEKNKVKKWLEDLLQLQIADNLKHDDKIMIKSYCKKMEEVIPG